MTSASPLVTFTLVPDRLPLLLWGLALTALVALPLIQGAPAPPDTPWALALPPLALAFALLHPTPLRTHFLFLFAHLPALLLIPALTAPAALPGFIAVALAATLFLTAATPRLLPASRARPAPLVAAATLLTLTTGLAFAIPPLTDLSAPPLARSAALLLAPPITFWLLASRLAPLVSLASDPRAHRTALAALTRRYRHPRPVRLTLALLIFTLALGLWVAWARWSLR